VKIIQHVIPALRGFDIVPIVGQVIGAFAGGAAATGHCVGHDRPLSYQAYFQMASFYRPHQRAARTVTQPRFVSSKWPFQSLKRSETIASARFSNRFMKRID